MKIFLNGMSPGTAKEDVAELMSHYAEVLSLEMVDSELPKGEGAVITIKATNAEAHWVANRLTGMYWQGHTLSAYVSLFSND